MLAEVHCTAKTVTAGGYITWVSVSEPTAKWWQYQHLGADTRSSHDIAVCA